MHEYLQFLKRKTTSVEETGIKNPLIHHSLKSHQSAGVQHALACGRSALFYDTGLGKTIMQLEWARHVPCDVLIAAPLAVAHQTIRESERFLGMPVAYSKDGTVTERVTITNYERIHLFDCARFGAVVLDESSILKGQSSKTRGFLTEAFKHCRWKLACTATPAPNDYMELGNHAEFLGIMSQQEMLSRWFVHDSANTADWRLKGHAVKPFWEWVASWAACVSMPSDLGYSDEGYKLPPLKITTHRVDVETKSAFENGLLFDLPEMNATSLHRSKRDSVQDRVALVSSMVNGSNEQWLVWCESNQESELLKRAIPDSVEVKGSDSPEHKENALLGFSDGKYRVLVSKASICGFGMNWQQCSNICFASISYSYEQFYQAVRRCWRFGQTKHVNVHVVISDAEVPVWRAIERKATDHNHMKSHMRFAIFKNAKESKTKIDYNPQHQGSLPEWL
jgi:superfamily II DNA or RNA helicase